MGDYGGSSGWAQCAHKGPYKRERQPEKEVVTRPGRGRPGDRSTPGAPGRNAACRHPDFSQGAPVPPPTHGESTLTLFPGSKAVPTR